MDFGTLVSGFQLVKRKIFYKLISIFLIIIISIYIFLSIFTSIQAFKINGSDSELNPNFYNIYFEDIEFKNENSTTLRGWWIDGETKKTIILLHGLRSNMSNKFYVDLIKEFHNLGFSILAFDFRNHGKSDSGKFTFGVDEINDIKAAMKYANENKNINNFGIWGFSYGATTSSIFNLSNKKINEKFNVVGIVADTPFFDPLEVLVDEVTKRTPLNSFLSSLLEPGIIFSSKVFYDLDLGEIKYIFDSEQASKFPSLVIGCDNDKTVPVSHPKRVNKALGKYSKYIEYKNCSNHGDAFIYNKNKYIEDINNFFKIKFENESK